MLQCKAYKTKANPRNVELHGMGLQPRFIRECRVAPGSLTGAPRDDVDRIIGSSSLLERVFQSSVPAPRTHTRDASSNHDGQAERSVMAGNRLHMSRRLSVAIRLLGGGGYQ